MIILDGTQSAKSWREQIATHVTDWTQKHQQKPKLAVVLVGQNPASEIYVANKQKAAINSGMDFELFRLPTESTTAQVKATIQTINQDSKIHAMLLQLPLPSQVDAFECIESIHPGKDADCLTSFNLGLFYKGLAQVSPCTPWGMLHLLKKYNIPMEGKKACVVGRSHIVGRPMAELLLQQNASVTVVHSKSKDLEEAVLNSDIVIAAAGKMHLLEKKHFKKGAVIVDVGIHRTKEGKVTGDVNPMGIEDWIYASSPVPGGVGPMTIAALLENTMRLAEGSKL